MQGQIIRVKGKFKGSNLPKLSDFDNSHLLQEILNHDACLSFYDFTDVNSMVLDGNKVISVADKKGRANFSATSVGLAPIYNSDLFGGRGGVLFNGAQEGGIANFYPLNLAISIDFFLQVVSTPASGNYFIASQANEPRNAIYYRSSALWGYNGNFSISWNGKAFNRNRLTTVHDYRDGVNPNVSFYLNDVKGVNTLANLNVKPSGKLNLGRWSDTSQAGYGFFALGSIILFDGDIKQDEYLDALLKEFYLRQYNI